MTHTSHDADTSDGALAGPAPVRELLGTGGKIVGAYAARILQRIPVALYVCDAAGRITFFNRRAVDLWGREPRLNDDAERFCCCCKLLGPDGTPLPADATPLALAVQSGRPAQGIEAVIERPDGSRVGVSLEIDPLRDQEGLFCGAIIVVQDITAHRQRERDARFLSELTERLATFTTEADIVRVTTQCLGEHLHVQQCGFFEADEPGGMITLSGGWRSPGEALAAGICVGDFVHVDTWRALAAGPLAVSDVSQHPLTTGSSAAYAALGVRSFAICACEQAKPRTFVLGISQEQPRTWADVEVKLLQDVVARVWPRIERARSEEARRAGELRHRQVLDALPVALYTCDSNRRLLWCNEAAVALWGFRPPVGVDHWSGAVRIYSPDGTPLAADEYPLARAVRENRPLCGEEIIVERADGTRRRVLAHPQPIRDDAGRISVMVNMLLDVTEMRRVEDDARRLAAIVESSADAIISTDLDGTILSWNGGAEQLFGFSAAEAVGRPITMLVPPGREDERPKLLERLRCAEKIDHYECVRARKDGRLLDISLAASTIRDACGRVVGISKIARDITEWKRAEAALRESRAIESARRAELEAVMQAAPAAIWIAKDPECRRIVGNPTAAAMLRVSPDANLSKSAADGTSLEHVTMYIDGRRIAPEDLPIQVAGRTGVPVLNQEIELRFNDGTSVWEFGNAVPRLDEDGMVAGVVAVSVNITAAKEAQLALRESEGRFRALASHAPVGIFLTDSKGECLFVNESWCAMAGLTPLEARGRGWERALHPDDRERVLTEWEHALRLGATSTAEYRFMRPDGSITWISGKAVLVREDNGGVAGYIGTVTDVTVRKLADDKLRAQEARLRLISSNAPVGLAQCDRQCRYLFVNRANAQRVQLEPGEIVGKTVSEVMGPGAMQVLQPYIDRVLAGESVTFEAEIPYTLLGRRFMRISYTPDFDEDGSVRGWLSATSDITERREIENALRAAQERLQVHAAELEQHVEERTASLREAIVQMEEFSYSVSHDLRAPLRAMNAYAQALAEDYAPHLDETARGYLHRIQRASRRMEMLTYDLLAFSRVARADIQLTEVNVAALLREIVGQFAELQPAAADVEIEPDLLPVFAHESSLGQCLGNLLTNAAKFVAPGVRPHIRVRTERAGESVRIWIEDNGIGIDARYQARLFGMFERVPTPHAYDGTGMGLAIVRRAVEKMGGRCGVDSDGRTGSRFWIELPGAPSPLKAGAI